MSTESLARRLDEWRRSAILWKGRAQEAEATLDRVRRAMELGSVTVADLEDALGEHVSPPRGPHVVPTSPRVVPTSDTEGAA